MSKKHVIEGVEVELDDDIDPDEVERYGADSRTGAIDLDAIEREAEADAALEQPDDGEEEYL